MKATNFNRDWQGGDAVPHLGYNILEGLRPKLCDLDGNPMVVHNRKNHPDENAILQMTAPYETEEHIDIRGENCKMTFDLGRSIGIDRVFVSGYWHPTLDCMLADYELFFSDDENNLFSPENRLCHVDNNGLWQKGTPRQSELFIDAEGVTARYFGMRVNKSCAFDDIIRIGCLALYSNRLDREMLFIPKHFDHNILKADDIKILGLSDDFAKLTDSVCFRKDEGVPLPQGKLVLHPQKSVKALNFIGLFGDYTVSTADCEGDLFLKAADGTNESLSTDGAEERADTFIFSDASKKYIGVAFDGADALIEQITALTEEREAFVDTEKIRTEDFIGIGANDLPMARMPESRQKGFRDVYWPVYRHRLIKSQPAALRVWFQLDWVVDNEADYNCGKCNFESDKMHAFYPYLDAYEAAGIEVEFNFGWKAGTTIQEWFSVPETSVPKEHGGGDGRAASAPRNFEGFAKCCAATVKELCESRGYTCIKHLTFYNESNYGDSSRVHGDFLGYYGHSKEMWEKMLRLVDAELQKNGAKKYVDYWLAEESGLDEIELEWMHYMKTHCKEFLSVNTFHRYFRKHDDRLDYFGKIRRECEDKPAVASEFAVYLDTPLWNMNNIEYVMSLLHSGLNGGLYWILQGVMLTDPTWLYLRGSDISNWWLPAYEKNGMTTETIPYHEFSLFTHYMPRHSKVLCSDTSEKDLRIEAIETPDGHYTVFLECNDTAFDKEVTVKFPKNIGKTFYKHVYRRGVKRDGNLAVPASEKAIAVADTLKDNVGKDYSLVAYTTMPEFLQVNMEKTLYQVKPGSKTQLSADIVGTDGALLWKIETESGPHCEISSDGVFTASEKSQAGDLYCVSATLKDNSAAFGVAMIEII